MEDFSNIKEQHETRENGTYVRGCQTCIRDFNTQEREVMTPEKAVRIIRLAFLNTDGHIKDNLDYSAIDIHDALETAVTFMEVHLQSGQ